MLPDYPGQLDTWGGPPDSDAALDELIGAAVRVLAAWPDAPIAFRGRVDPPG